MNSTIPRILSCTILASTFGLATWGSAARAAGEKPVPTVVKAQEEPAKAAKGKQPADPFAEYVWPPPPDKARIKLEAVIAGRIDVEGESKLKRALLGASPKSPWDDFVKPHDVAFDLQGRVLVTDWGSGALIRIDAEKRVYDVLGTQGAQRLVKPLGLCVAPDGTIYVSDQGAKKVLAFTPEGKVKAVYGKQGELVNPTDAALSPDGKKLYVADSKAHQIVVFDVASGARTATWGKVGTDPGQFHFPTSLTVGRDGSVYVVDQLNARVQILSPAGEPTDAIGSLGTGFGNFIRPKGVAIDELGFLYVADNALNNIQIFDADLTLLTFVGTGGTGPGAFHGLSGVAIRGDRIAAVDQLGHRLQLFRFVGPRAGD